MVELLRVVLFLLFNHLVQVAHTYLCETLSVAIVAATTLGRQTLVMLLGEKLKVILILSLGDEDLLLLVRLLLLLLLRVIVEEMIGEICRVLRLLMMVVATVDVQGFRAYCNRTRHWQRGGRPGQGQRASLSAPATGLVADPRLGAVKTRTILLGWWHLVVMVVVIDRVSCHGHGRVALIAMNAQNVRM